MTTNQIDTATFHVLNLIERGFATDFEIIRGLRETDGAHILADIRAPGRQVDKLAALNLIAFDGERAVIVKGTKPFRVV